jgi:hypothetical protein
LIWDAPQRAGIYNIAILITEYRNGVRIGTVLRDLQIIVESKNNRPPVIIDNNIICKVAGDTIKMEFIATDPDIGQRITMSSNGGPYIVSDSPANFIITQTGNPAKANFVWNTNCSHLQNNDYQIIVKAEDSAPTPLVDLNTVIIKVLPPPPLNLSGSYNPLTKKVLLKWDSLYTCSSNSKFQGFSIWKKKGCNNPIDTCSPDPSLYGYTKIGSTKAYSFEEVVQNKGNIYSYIVVADFGELSNVGFVFNKFSSLPSQEICIEISTNVPLIYNVDVVNTDNSIGQIYIEWSKPSVPSLDTNIFKGPYKFELYRAEKGTALYSKIVTYNSNTFYQLLDTTFLDSNIDTKTKAYQYYVLFIANNTDTVGASEVASSVYLFATPSDKTIDLSWNFNVPWENQQYVIYRQNPTTLTFDSIFTTSNTQYKHTNLSNDTTYCYKVKSIGEYTVQGLKSPLFNNSQIVCAQPKDTLPPCATILEIENFCNNKNLPVDTFINYLSWKTPPTCNDTDIVNFKIYYALNSNSNYTIIDSTNSNIFEYTHILDKNLSGCYKIEAIDRTQNKSFSNTVCVEDCPIYNLPNTFTPNGDSFNELFTPIIPYGGVSRVDFTVFTVWGGKVFQTNDVNINWNGKDFKDNDASRGRILLCV